MTLDEDPIPYTRSLMARTISGNMLAQLFGGGTANMEFEALTGQSLSQFLPQMNTPYQMLRPQVRRISLDRRLLARAKASPPWRSTPS